MSRLPIPASIDASPSNSQTLLEAVKKQLGSVPNLFRLVGNSPAALEGYLSLNGALSKGSLDGQVREQIALLVAESNGCDYCLSAHTYLGKNLAKLDESEIVSARLGKSSNPKHNAALAFASEILATRGHVSTASISQAKSAGLNDAQLVEIVLHVALNTLTNYVNSVAETEVDFPKVAVTGEYNGLCAVAVSMGERVPSDASSISYHQGRVFRLSSAEAKAMFDGDPAGFTAKADARWPSMR